MNHKLVTVGAIASIVASFITVYIVLKGVLK